MNALAAKVATLILGPIDESTIDGKFVLGTIAQYKKVNEKAV